MKAPTTAALATMLLAFTGCFTVVGENEPAGKVFFHSEWGGSEVTTIEIDRRTTAYPDGHTVVEEGIVEEHAKNDGLGENLKGLLAGAIGYLFGSGL
jgi:hypothetical protein